MDSAIDLLMRESEGGKILLEGVERLALERGNARAAHLARKMLKILSDVQPVTTKKAKTTKAVTEIVTGIDPERTAR